jgi:hypothetical protein
VHNAPDESAENCLKFATPPPTPPQVQKFSPLASEPGRSAFRALEMRSALPVGSDVTFGIKSNHKVVPMCMHKSVKKVIEALTILLG